MERFNSHQNVKPELKKHDDYTLVNLDKERIDKLVYNFKLEQKEKCPVELGNMVTVK